MAHRCRDPRKVEGGERALDICRGGKADGDIVRESETQILALSLPQY